MSALELKPDDYIVGAWFSENPSYGNQLIILKKTIDKDHFEAMIRLRKYKDDKIFDSDDEKTVYHVVIDKSELEAIEIIEGMIKVVAPLGLDKVDFLEIKGSPTDLIEKGKSKPWFNIMKKPKSS